MPESVRIYAGISASKEVEVIATAMKMGQKLGIPAVEYEPAKLKENIRNGSLDILIRTSLHIASVEKDVAFAAKLVLR